MRNYVVDIDGDEYDARSDVLPLGVYLVRIGYRTTKRASVLTGPNYDGTWNSVLAAMEYEPVRKNMRHNVLRYLLRRNGQWVNGNALSVGGAEAKRRVRELRYNFGWPIEERSRGRGVWDYRMNLQHRIRLIERP